MPCPPRFELPGAIYHIINRGNYRSWVFEDESTKCAFQKSLFEASEITDWTLHAHCVMGNHYHLAIEVPFGQLLTDCCPNSGYRPLTLDLQNLK